MKIQFEKNFWWGTAISGPQSEGIFAKSNLNIMDYWYQQSPEDFHNQMGPEIASDMYHHYNSDIKIMQELNLNSYRTSIQWTRLIKNIKTGEIDQEGYQFYRAYFQKLHDANIKTIVNLYHFDMPIELENIGGWTNKEVVDLYVKYAQIAFECFGDIVDYWATFNEPVVPIEGCYLYQWYYPKIVDFQKGIQAGFNTIVAHAKTVNLFHKMFKHNPNKKITVILNLTPAYPKDQQAENVEAAEIRDLLFNKAFLDTMVLGTFPDKLVELLKQENILPFYTTDEIEAVKDARIDFLGVNYYQPSRIQARTIPWNNNDPIMPAKWFENYQWPERRINPYRGWEIHPQTLYEIGINIKNNYNNIPWIVSENGMGVEDELRYQDSNGQINDNYRIDFIKEHLYWLNQAIKQGSNCFGYQLWTFVDCWSWANSYKNRYGIVSLDLETQTRTIKKSGYWFKEIIENNNVIEIEEGLIK
ncbi:glycoside hydrolase family 1 protein [Mesoplasma seiffertii]|uniref:glycoside hydrolase family 1 protein n=1 Tax=Mesoplasma seiffertii TaxID=28224 RepID=UPI0005659425|nr:glycoside hydrolase family 1 protein [Mesoplasma seiffertii]